jgi:hypothetical protein
MNSITDVSEFYTSSVVNEEMCQYDLTKREFKMSYNCWFKLNGGYTPTKSLNVLTKFQSDASFPIAVGACEVSDVRKISTSDWFTRNLQYMYSNTTVAEYRVCSGIPADHCIPPTTPAGQTADAGSKYFVHPYFEKDATTATYKATLSVKKAMCAGCYQSILNELQKDYSTSLTAGSVIENCKKDPKSVLCLGTPYMAEKLAKFKQCSGYAIDFVGPVCTGEKMAAIAKNLRPIPYHLFVNCAVNAASNSQICSSAVVTQFLSDLNTIAGSDCYSCFTEFKTAIDGLAADSNVVTACSTSITSDTCKAALKAPIDSFIECSGFEPSGKRSKSVMKSSIIGAIIFVGLSIAL